MKLTIVIPALNEEQAIGSIIERTLAARETIIADSPVEAVEIVVVSDGSTDRTPEIAASYDEIALIVFEKNRGYGAAIKRGFEVGTGDVVGFLDADGTCEPAFFATLCRELAECGASVAIGSRLGPDSEMPRVRRFGNRVYAFILSALSNKVVTDTASGMRVIRRDVLQQLYPLPDGLHFTPAMSARVLMDDQLTIVEKPMCYKERVGESKLHVIKDGLRFFRTIFEMTLMWRPAKLFFASAAMCLCVMMLLAAHPIESWLRMGRFNDDMIYRLLFCSLLGSLGVSLISMGVLAVNLHRMVNPKQSAPTFLATILDRLYSAPGALAVTLLTMPGLLWLVGEGVWTRITLGVVELHWSRVVLAGVVVFAIAQLALSVLLANIMRYHAKRANAQRQPSSLQAKSAPRPFVHATAANQASSASIEMARQTEM